MANNWPIGTLKELADVVMGTSPPGITCNVTGEGLPLLNGPTEFKSYSPKPDQYTTAPVKTCRPGDILFCVRGSTTGRMNWADREYAIGRGLAAIRHSSSPNCQPLVRGIIETNLPKLLAVATGSTFPSVSKDSIEQLTCHIPPPHHQQVVAAFLGMLDDKIRLNGEMNETLEAIAHALFKSWFVDFDPVRIKATDENPARSRPTAAQFPNQFENSEFGEIPKGWIVGSILNHAKLLSGGTPKTNRSDFWDGNILWASAKDVSRCGQTFLVTTERTITEIGLKSSATQVIPRFCTVIVARGATTGRMVLFGCDMAMNQTCYALASSVEAPFTLYCQLRHKIDDLVRTAHGSVFDTITTSTFASSRIVLPPKPAVEAFERIVAPIFRRILENTCESRNLTAARDALLPKVLSGELLIEAQ